MRFLSIVAMDFFPKRLIKPPSSRTCGQQRLDFGIPPGVALHPETTTLPSKHNGIACFRHDDLDDFFYAHTIQGYIRLKRGKKHIPWKTFAGQLGNPPGILWELFLDCLLVIVSLFYVCQVLYRGFRFCITAIRTGPYPRDVSEANAFKTWFQCPCSLSWHIIQPIFTLPAFNSSNGASFGRLVMAVFLFDHRIFVAFLSLIF